MRSSERFNTKVAFYIARVAPRVHFLEVGNVVCPLKSANFPPPRVRLDSAAPAAAARGRKPAPSGRSRQQVQREKALQLAAHSNHTVASSALQPEQQLAKPPPNEHLGDSTPDVVVKEVDQLKASEVIEHHQPPVEGTSPGVKELDKEEVEVLVWESAGKFNGLRMFYFFKRLCHFCLCGLRREKTRLEQLQQEQKIIEERNKRTKALLAKTIAEK